MGNVTLLSYWLDCNSQVSTRYGKFDLIEICEINDADDLIIDYMEKLFIESRIKWSVFKDIIEQLEWDEAETFISGLMPQCSTARKGFFGEVLLCTLLKTTFNYEIPIQKLRYGITKDQTLPGTDIIAIKTNGNTISEVCFVESKLRTVNDPSAAIQGYDQLIKYHSKKYPDMLIFLLGRLDETGNQLYPNFLRYCTKRADLSNMESFCLGLTWDPNTWDEKGLEKLADHVDENLPKLVVNRILIGDLERVLQKIFQKFGTKELIDD